MGLPTGDEDASRYDGLERLAAEQLLLVGPIVELFRDVGDGFRKGELVAPTRDIAEGLEEDDRVSVVLSGRGVVHGGAEIEIHGSERGAEVSEYLRKIPSDEAELEFGNGREQRNSVSELWMPP